MDLSDVIGTGGLNKVFEKNVLRTKLLQIRYLN